jgi:hypothetical protein
MLILYSKFQVCVLYLNDAQLVCVKFECTLLMYHEKICLQDENITRYFVGTFAKLHYLALLTFLKRKRHLE